MTPVLNGWLQIRLLLGGIAIRLRVNWRVIDSSLAGKELIVCVATSEATAVDEVVAGVQCVQWCTGRLAFMAKLVTSNQ